MRAALPLLPTVEALPSAPAHVSFEALLSLSLSSLSLSLFSEAPAASASLFGKGLGKRQAFTDRNLT